MVRRSRLVAVSAVLASVLASVLVSVPSSAVPAPATRGAGAYAAPVPLRVVRPFEAPATPFGPGHRGVDLAVRPAEAVHAAAAGVVSFAGSVAGRGVVVVQHADGVSTEYEPITSAVRRGASVRVGQVLGHVHGRHGACVPDRCLHWGARRDETYFDPLLLLAPLGPVRLLPWRS